MATKLEGMGVKSLVAGPLKKTFFCGFPRLLESDTTISEQNIVGYLIISFLILLW